MVVERDGDILLSGADVICHQVNCKGVMGAGLARQIRLSFPNTYSLYLEKCESGNCLGDAQFCDEGEQIIANLFAQDGYGTDRAYTDYDALRKALCEVKSAFGQESPQKRIAVPHGLGCGLAGGDWNIVRRMIEDIFGGSECICEIWKLGG